MANSFSASVAVAERENGLNVKRSTSPDIPRAACTSASVMLDSTIRVEAMETTEAVAGADNVIPDKTVPDDVSTVLESVIATMLALSFPAAPVRL